MNSPNENETLRNEAISLFTSSETSRNSGDHESAALYYKMGDRLANVLWTNLKVPAHIQWRSTWELVCAARNTVASKFQTAVDQAAGRFRD